MRVFVLAFFSFLIIPIDLAAQSADVQCQIVAERSRLRAARGQLLRHLKDIFHSGKNEIYN